MKAKLPLPKILDSVISFEIQPIENYLDGGETELELTKQLSLLMLNTSSFLGVKRIPNDPTFVKVVEKIISDFKDLTFDDFVLFFAEIENGKYGEMYENFSGQKIMIYLNQYCERRESELIDAHKRAYQKKDKELELALPQIKESPEQKEFISKLVKDVVSENKQSKLIQKTELHPFQLYVELLRKIDALIKEINDGKVCELLKNSIHLQIYEYDLKINEIESYYPEFANQEYFDAQYQIFFPNLSK